MAAAAAEEDDGRPLEEKMFLSDLCKVYDKLDTHSGRDKIDTLRRLVDSWRNFATSVERDSFYPVMRLVLPDMDNGRPAYGLRESALAKDYISVLGLNPKGQDALKLLHYKQPGRTGVTAGDFAGTAAVVLTNRCGQEGKFASPSIGEFNVLLDQLAGCSKLEGKLKSKARQRILGRLIKVTTAGQHKWVIRIILKDLKMGVNQGTMFSAFHPDAEHLYNISHNLKKICHDLHNPETRLDKTTISLFQPIRPMLAQRGEHGLEKMLGHLSGAFYVETKFDGDRFQIHKSGNVYKYFTRNGNDYTHKFGGDPSQGSHCPFIHPLFERSVKSCILDGEMVAWNTAKKGFTAKGENVDVKNVGNIASNTQNEHLIPCFIAFDIIYLNGENMCELALVERKEKLAGVFKEETGRMVKASFSVGRSKDDFLRAVNQSIDDQEEGIVLKAPSSSYKPHARRAGWWKWKPEYVDQLSDDLDLLIVGGYFGEGRRGGQVSHFMLAVAEPPQEGEDKPSVFHSFCKVGSGYTYKELAARGKLLAQHWKRVDKRSGKCGLGDQILLAGGKGSQYKELPDVWIDPHNSMVVQIKAAEICPSDRWSAGYTLRFPRLQKFRDDKNWDQIMTTDELDALRTAAAGRLTSKHMNESDVMSSRTSKRRRVAKVSAGMQLVEHQRATDVSKVKQTSDALGGMEFCVLRGTKLRNKAELETGIKQHGGTFVQGPGKDTSCIISGHVDYRTKNMIKEGRWDVVDANWLIACLNERALIELNPRWMHFTTPETSQQFAESVDPFGDSYTVNCTADSLCETFAHIRGKGLLPKHCPEQLTDDQMKEVEDKYFPNQSLLGLFRRTRIYLDLYEVIGDATTPSLASPLDLIAAKVEFHGGAIVDQIREDTTHIVVHTAGLDRLAELHAMARAMRPMPHVVSHNWVLESLADQWLLDEQNFRLLTRP